MKKDFLHKNILIDNNGNIYEAILGIDGELTSMYDMNSCDASEITHLSENAMEVGGKGSKSFILVERNKTFIILDIYNKDLTLNKIENKLRFHIEKIIQSL